MSTIYSFLDPQTSSQWVTILLQVCANSPVVLQTAAEHLVVSDLTRVMRATYAQAVLFQALVSYWSLYKSVPTPEVLAVAVSTVLNQMSCSQAHKSQMLDEFGSLVKIIFTPPAQNTDKLALDIIKTVHTKARIEPELTSLAQQAPHMSVEELYDNVAQLRARVITDKVPKNVFDLSVQEALSQEFSSGLSWFDDLIGGGFRSGEAYGILAETGGGKTTLAAALSCALAAQNKKVVIIVTEQSFQESSLRAKFWAAVTKVNWREFEKFRSMREVPEQLVPSHMRQAIEKIQQNIFGFDLEDVASIDDVRSIVLQHRPDVFIVDWAGTLADRLMSDRNNPWHNDRHLCLRAIANEVNALSKMTGSSGIVFHQLKPDGDRNPFRNYDHTQAAECKTFCWNLSFGIVMSPRDSNNIMRIACTKSRLSMRKECIVRMDGATCSFEHLVGYKKSTRRGVWIKASSEDLGVLPTYKNEV